MEYTKPGNTGLTASRICLGCMSYGEGNWREWTLDKAAARGHFSLAIESGVTFFDTADVYSNGSSEEIAAMEAPYRPHAIVGHSQPSPARILM